MSALDQQRLITQLLLLVISMIGVVRYKSLTTAYRLVTAVLIATFIVEGANWILAKTIRNNLITSHFFGPIEFVLISLVYYHLFTNKTGKKAIMILIPLMVCFSLYNTLFLQSIWQFASNFMIVQLGLYLVYTLLGFSQMLLHPENKSLMKQPMFWLNTGLLIYSSTVVFKFGVTNYLIDHHVHPGVLNYVVVVANFVLFIMMGAALYLANKKL